MCESRFTPEQVIRFSDAVLCKWHAKCGGLQIAAAKCLREPDTEGSWLKLPLDHVEDRGQDCLWLWRDLDLRAKVFAYLGDEALR